MIKSLCFIVFMTTVCLAQDITGWKGLSWGDSIQKANEELKPLSLCQPIYLTGEKYGGCEAIQPRAELYSTIIIGGKAPRIRLVFEKTSGTLVEVQLMGTGIDDSSLMAIRDALKNKYGQPDKTPSPLNSLWIKNNGILEISIDTLKKRYTIEYSSNTSAKALQLHQQNFENYL